MMTTAVEEHTLFEEVPGQQAKAGNGLEALPQEMADDELLATVLAGSGEDDPLGAARGILSGAGGLYGLRRMEYANLGQLPATAGSRAVAGAVAELCRRMADARGPELPRISGPGDVHALLGPRLQDLDREHFVVVLLDTKNQVLGTPAISVGTLSSSLVHPREVFKPAIAASAANVILVHNHPSGKLTPSQEDRQVSSRMAQAGSHIGIEILDNIIIGREGEGYRSLKENGELYEPS